MAILTKKEERDCFETLSLYREVMNNMIENDKKLRSDFISNIKNNVSMNSFEKLRCYYLPDIFYEHDSLGENVYCSVRKAYNSIKEKNPENQEYTMFYDLVDSAIDYIMKKNEGLVYYMAKRFKKLDFEDAKQAGRIGLLRAIDAFDHRKERKLSTYALYHIKRSIQEESTKGDLESKPYASIGIMYKINQFKEKFMHEHGLEATIEDIKEGTGLDKEEIRSYCLGRMGNFGFFDTDEKKFESIFENPNEDSPDRSSELKLLRDIIDESLKKLSEKEKIVIEMRYGLNSYMTCRSIDEVSEFTGMTKEKTRQTEAKILRGLFSKLERIN